MKFYRVSMSTVSDGHRGYSWHTVRREAERVRDRYLKDSAEYEASLPEDRRIDGLNASAGIDEVEVVTTKRGILAALNRYASHPSNG